MPSSPDTRRGYHMTARTHAHAAAAPRARRRRRRPRPRSSPPAAGPPTTRRPAPPGRPPRPPTASTAARRPDHRRPFPVTVASGQEPDTTELTIDEPRPPRSSPSARPAPRCSTPSARATRSSRSTRSRTSRRRRRSPTCPASSPTSRRSSATPPTWSSPPATRATSSARSTPPACRPCCCPRRSTSRRPTTRSSASALPPATSTRPRSSPSRWPPTSRPPSPRSPRASLSATTTSSTRRSSPRRGDTFIGQVYGLFGLENIADETGEAYPQLSQEFIVEADPDVVFVTSGDFSDSPEDDRRPPGLGRASPRSRTGTCVVVDADTASRWGPRVVDFVETVAEALPAGPRLDDGGHVTSDAVAGAARPGRALGPRRCPGPGGGPCSSSGPAAVLARRCCSGVLVGPAGLTPGGVLASLAGALPGVRRAHRASPTSSRRSCGRSGCRASSSAPWSGPCSPLAGAAYQGVFRNPLADPYLLGVSSGAGLGATLAIVSGGVVARARPARGGLRGRPARGRRDVRAGQQRRSRRTELGRHRPGRGRGRGVPQRHPDVRPAAATTRRCARCTRWLLGRLSTQGWDEVLTVLPYVVARQRRSSCCTGGCSTSWPSATPRPAASASTPPAPGWSWSLAATLGTAAVVSVSGLIGFVGIVVPHAVRLAARRRRTGCCCRCRCSSVRRSSSAADVLARTVLSPAELPIGVVTALVGAPFFVVVLRRARMT